MRVYDITSPRKKHMGRRIPRAPESFGGVPIWPFVVLQFPLQPLGILQMIQQLLQEKVVQPIHKQRVN